MTFQFQFSTLFSPLFSFMADLQNSLIPLPKEQAMAGIGQKGERLAINEWGFLRLKGQWVKVPLCNKGLLPGSQVPLFLLIFFFIAQQHSIYSQNSIQHNMLPGFSVIFTQLFLVALMYAQIESEFFLFLLAHFIYFYTQPKLFIITKREKLLAPVYPRFLS